MPNIGFWATAGAGGAAAGAYELIETISVASSTSTITFASIPSTYKHLQLRATMRGASGFTNDRVTFQMNGLGGTNYARHWMSGNGSTVTSTGNASQSQIYNGLIPAGNAVANSFSAFIVDIADYASTSKYKTIKTFGGASWDSAEVWIGSGLVQTTNAVTSLTIGSVNGSISLGRFSLYGIKG